MLMISTFKHISTSLEDPFLAQRNVVNKILTRVVQTKMQPINKNAF